MSPDEVAEAPAIGDVRRLHGRLGKWLVRTPMLRCANLEHRLRLDTEIFGKLEFLQTTGTFKPRGALAVMLGLDPQQLERGVIAFSAGNHAIATAFAARATGSHAKVVMTRTASQARIDACRKYGAEVLFADNVHQAFEMAEHVRQADGRYLVHPFEGRTVATGTATIGLEICEQLPEFDAIVIPIGGGGLCGGIASAVKTLNPGCEVIGVEPSGADTMSRSFASGKPEAIATVSTIADSLGAPFAMPYSYAMCRRYVDELVTVDDDELRAAMAMLYQDMKFAVEPACAASTAALAGPLRGRFAGRRVVLVFCGSNIDWTRFANHAGMN